MKKKSKTQDIDLSDLSRQSGLSLDKMNVKKKSSAMRTTFRLTEQTIESLNKLSKDIKMKDLFDAFGNILTDKNQWFTNAVVQLAEGVNTEDLKKCDKKSFAISKKVVKIINELSKKNKIVRDALVNQTITSFDILMKFLKEKDDEKVKQAKKIIYEFWGKAFELEKKISELLGNDHEVTDGVGRIYSYIESFLYEIDEYLETGDPIDVLG